MTDREKLMETPIEDLEVSVALSRVLGELGAATFGQLLEVKRICASRLVLAELQLLFRELGVTYGGVFEVIQWVVPPGRRVPRLTIRYEEGGDGEPTSRVGGRPSAWSQPEGWPECGLCQRPLRFVAQIAGPLETGGIALGKEEAVQVFACLHDDSGCASWTPLGRANAALVRKSIHTHAREGGAEPFPCFRMVLSPEWDDAVLLQPSEDAEDTAEFWEAFSHGQVDKVGGIAVAGNDPSRPECPQCRRAMTLLAQLGHVHVPMPFDDGIGFVHICPQRHAASLQYVR